MIQIENIRKTYVTGDLTQKALDDVSLNLRDSEFVAILGPSGSGKTTLLNIIGGLDRYDSGDLVINGTSTKKYKDRDWDSYRNHSIGFVFQAYNLIPHQTLLSNVELALTISGISKAERKERALCALDEVGLKEHAYKKPNQLSGGQMQRVAIARALVNNPDILLADEPTGALDSQTSIQVMDLLKEVAKDRLVVMVTHNPELAKQYATRIVKLRDGQIVDDSKPYNPRQGSEKDNKIFGKAKMSFLTALSLSFNNLLTKKGRTILVSFAGSIGIIGIALILSMSQGFQNYIDKIQEDTLTSYPLQITKETANVSSIVLSMSGQDGAKKDKKNKTKKGEVVEQQYMTSFADSIGINDLQSFKKHLEDTTSKVKKDVARIDYSYSVEPCVYTIDATNTLTQINPNKSTTNTMYSSSAMSNMGMDMGGTFFEVPSNIDALKDQYKIVAGHFPKKYNEVILTLQKKDEISDLLVYSLGLRDSKELSQVMKDVMAGKKPKISNKAKTFTYKELMNLKFKLVNPSDMYRYNSEYKVYENMSNDNNYAKEVFDKSENLKIVGVVVSKDEKSIMSRSGIAYTTKLTDHVISTASKSEIVKKQLENEELDILTNKKFDNETNASKGPNLQNMISIDNNALTSAFNMDGISGINIDEKQTQQIVMSAASECANKLVNGINPTDLSQALIGINSVILSTAASNYDDANVLNGRLSLANVESEKSKITKEKYKQMLETIISSDSNFSQMSILTQMLTDQDYEKLSDIVRTMFDGYYSELTTGTYGYDKTTKTIAYLKVSSLAIYGGAPNTSITALQLVGKANQISSVVSRTADMVNSIMHTYAVAIVGQSIGQATSEVISPVMSSLKKMSGFKVDEKKIAQAFKFNMTEEALQRLMETMMSSNDRASYETNLTNLGYQDKASPASISFYFKSFKNKDRFLKFIDKYNKEVKKKQKIEYTDTTGLLMSSVQTIVDSVSYVLIAFVSVSLIVSSIMIAVITLISVMERRKEIGILRAMGASKRNVSNIFNAETFIIGLLSGLTGILISLLFLLPINGIIHLVNHDITAVLPLKYGVILVLISVGLTMIAGFIPSKKASKSDPVEALRSE